MNRDREYLYSSEANHYSEQKEYVSPRTKGLRLALRISGLLLPFRVKPFRNLPKKPKDGKHPFGFPERVNLRPRSCSFCNSNYVKSITLSIIEKEKLTVSNVEKEIKKKYLQISSKSGFTQACLASTSQPPARQDRRVQKTDGPGRWVDADYYWAA